MDFPTAWKIAKLTTIEGHDPKCSYAKSKGGVLCDCYILTRHPEYLKDYGFLKKNTLNIRNPVYSVLGKIIDIIARINEGANMMGDGDIEQRIEEVQNDLSDL